MAYMEGFVIPVAKANWHIFKDFVDRIDPMFLELGALRVVECWADDVPDGTLTDFRKSVQAKEDEDVVFAWIEWPDKETPAAAFTTMTDPDNKDPRMDQTLNPVPFDGKRMIFGGFMPVIDIRT
jgi:uncharacterized protein YbaA (DUF1428 family)